MLINLFIKDFGIIEKAEINFGPGLNVLSGETGSGKSIIIDAMHLVSGGRAFVEFIRSGCERSIIQLTADTAGLTQIEKLLDDRGINSDNSEIIVMARELSRNGRSTCRINGQIVTLNVYKEFGQALLDIQGQHDQQTLFFPDRHLQLLDFCGGKETLDLVFKLKQLYREYTEKRKNIEYLQDRCREWARRQDVITFQINDIENVNPVCGEDNELLAERKKLVNIEKLSSLVNESYCKMYGDGSSESIADLAGKVLRNIEKAAEVDSSLSHARELISQIFYQIEESCRELATYRDGLEFSPARLDHIESRLEKLSRLKKKYGDTIDTVLQYKYSIEKELLEMRDGGQQLDILMDDLANTEQRQIETSSILTEKRIGQAKELEKQVKKELFDLEMSGALFVVKFTSLENIVETGKEKVEFYISANAGEPVKPLSKVASGGEASRILLAIKGILAEMEETPTLVFDEVDTGIGGKTIKSVAKKLKKLSTRRQVICVTHSPQVASAADSHFFIKKVETGGRTTAEISALGEKERINELARMLGGDGKVTMDHAKQMLVETRNFK